jgi:hypothetical protein
MPEGKAAISTALRHDIKPPRPVKRGKRGKQILRAPKRKKPGCFQPGFPTPYTKIQFKNP